MEGPRFEVRQMQVWKHASLGLIDISFDATPMGGGWELLSKGWTVRDRKLGKAGLEPRDYFTREKAQAQADKLNNLPVKIDIETRVSGDKWFERIRVGETLTMPNGERWFHPYDGSVPMQIS